MSQTTPLIEVPMAALDGMSPQQFMRRHWQRRPLLVRQAFPGLGPLLSRQELLALAARDDMASRLVVRQGRQWSLRPGPLARRSLPPLSQPRWTVLVQAVEQQVPAARRLLDHFRFIPEARLDDLMVSWASDGGGVGPHLDSYDVFLIQLQGRRRWRIGPVADASWRPGLPLKILRRFEPRQQWVLDPGDMLYLPPRWAHEGTAVGPCMTASVGFRAPSARELAAELLARAAEQAADDVSSDLYRDPGAAATAAPGAMPASLQAFTRRSAERLLKRPRALEQVLGEYLTEPRPQVWFRPAGPAASWLRGVTLAAASRMMYDMHHVFINGESFRASGRDKRLMERLADRRSLEARHCATASPEAQGLLGQWLEQGWLTEGSHDA